ncbi:ABC transporter ATP-binding protein [Kineococcus rhizosphaerae]|uniref:Carbohydrate ABC transporter ATP-binding protein (CUT1 family) n=1 Tax=Kineococcus rhizosphaerae TaxID=559628 RepID=A0A2T0R6R5_9ACTN|nr:ABC transporter ATP-binding protein [Kineococcus rhizosphaerae]PRY16859.1 carbohydrate ABC transporter ATP-binding protein (CUT1 family) [Kineococcus rhizosphaerae]
MATVRIQNLSTTYGTGKNVVEALTDVDLDIGDGEFFVVLGPSGAGKTTMLKSVAGLVDTAAGDVEIAGVSMEGVEPYHRNVAMAFESYALYPQKTVFDNLASPLRSGRTGKYTAEQQRQRIEAVTTTLGIAHLLKRFPRELSNGQRQRVALGRVLVRPADVYLLDEPLSHLDAKLRAQMRAELKQLGEMSNTTSLYVTHDYQEALALGNRIAVLRAGRVVQVGTPEDIWRRPVDTFVAKALGQPEINLFDVVAEQGVLRGAGGDLSVPVPHHLDLPAGRARLGIRPRDLQLGAGGAGALSLRGRVSLAERLGRLMEFSVDVGPAGGSEHVIVVADSDAGAREGDVVDLHLPLENVHVFAPAAGPEDSVRLGSAVEERVAR